MDGESFAPGFHSVSNRLIQMPTDDSMLIDQSVVSVLDVDDYLSSSIDSTNMSYVCPNSVSSVTMPSIDSIDNTNVSGDCNRYEISEPHHFNVRRSFSKRKHVNNALQHYNDYRNDNLNVELSLTSCQHRIKPSLERIQSKCMESLKNKSSIPSPKNNQTNRTATDKTRRMIPLQRIEKPLSDPDKDESDRYYLYRRAH